MAGDAGIDLGVDQRLDLGRERIIPDRVRVLDLEAAPDELPDEVDRRAAQLVEARALEQDLELTLVLDSLTLGRLRVLFERHRVVEAGRTTPRDADADRTASGDVLHLHDLANLLARGVRDDH